MRFENEDVDPSIARSSDETCMRCPATAGPRIDEQDGSPRRVDDPPAMSQRMPHDPADPTDIELARSAEQRLPQP